MAEAKAEKIRLQGVGYCGGVLGQGGNYSRDFGSLA